MNKPSRQSIIHTALLVADYDEAIDFYVEKLGFDLLEDSFQAKQNKRWVTVRPRGDTGCCLLLAKASNPRQKQFVGNQAGGRVFLFLRTDQFDADFAKLKSIQAEIIRPPKTTDYGKVAVFADPFGNLWDLVEFAPDHPLAV